MNSESRLYLRPAVADHNLDSAEDILVEDILAVGSPAVGNLGKGNG